MSCLSEQAVDQATGCHLFWSVPSWLQKRYSRKSRSYPFSSEYCRSVLVSIGIILGSKLLKIKGKDKTLIAEADQIMWSFPVYAMRDMYWRDVWNSRYLHVNTLRTYSCTLSGLILLPNNITHNYQFFSHLVLLVYLFCEDYQLKVGTIEGSYGITPFDWHRHSGACSNHYQNSSSGGSSHFDLPAILFYSS